MKKKNLKAIALTLVTALAITAMPVGTVTAEAASKPAQVKNLKKTAVTSNSITVKFKKVKNIKGYQIRVYNTKNKLVKSKTTKKTTYKITGLKASTKYKIKVRAYRLNSSNKKVYGKLSSAITVKTKKKTTNKITPTPTPSLKKQYEKKRNAWLKKYNITTGKRTYLIENGGENKEDSRDHLIQMCMQRDLIPTVKNNGTDDLYLAVKRGTGSGKAVVKMIVDTYQKLGIKGEVIDDIDAYREKEKNYYGGKFKAQKDDKVAGWCLIDNLKQDKESEYYDVTLVKARQGVISVTTVSIPKELMEYFDD